MEAAPTDLRLPALGLLWIPLQQSLLVRVGMGVLGVAATDAFVLIWRAVLLLGILGGMLWGGSSADRPYVRAIGLAAHALWPLLLAASDGSAAPITSAVAAAIGASAVLLDSGMGVRAGITLLIGLAFHPFGDLIAFAHGQLGTCSAHFIACLLYGAVAVPRAAWSRLRGDLVVLVGCLGVIVALMPLCSLGASPRADLCAADGYRLLERLETPYSGWLSVVDDGDARTLRTTHALVGAVVRATGVPMDRPTLMLSAVQWREGRAGDRDVLLLRLGSGALAELFMLAGWTVNVAEPDPAAMYIAQTYFNMSFSPALIPRDPVEYFTPQKQQEEGEQQQREPAKDGPPMSAYDAILVRAITPAGNLDARIAYDDVILDSIRRALRPHGILALVRGGALMQFLYSRMHSTSSAMPRPAGLFWRI